MISICRLLVVLTITLFLVGCGKGNNFVRLENHDLSLGTTTYESIKDQMGAPQQEVPFTTNNKQFKLIEYQYRITARVQGDSNVSIYPETITKRDQSFFFYEGVLVGYQYRSTFKADHTNFDERKASEIKIGVSTREEVVALLGQPVGKNIYPLYEHNDGESIQYLYRHIRVHRKFGGTALTDYRKVLTFYLDGNGTVVDKYFDEVGEF